MFALVLFALPVASLTATALAVVAAWPGRRFDLETRRVLRRVNAVGLLPLLP